MVAEDIVHDAFMRFYLLDDPESIDNPFSYLLTICKNIHKDKIKASKVIDRYNEYYKKHGELMNEISPERMLIIDEKYSSTFKKIDRLPPRCKRVFIMHRVYSMSHKYIAKTLGISKHAVERHVIRAVERINAMK